MRVNHHGLRVRVQEQHHGCRDPTNGDNRKQTYEKFSAEITCFGFA